MNATAQGAVTVMVPTLAGGALPVPLMVFVPRGDDEEEDRLRICARVTVAAMLKVGGGCVG